MHNQLATRVAAGAFLIGSVGAALVLPNIVAAADPSAAPSATSSTAPATTPGTTGTTDPAGDHGGRGGHGGPGGLDADDLTAAAKALGMTEADLTAALGGGKTAAGVAADKGVAVQKVVDAIVAADQAEIAAAVKAGTITQAQADQRLANLAAHVTDEVNGVGRHGMGGHGPDGTPPSGTQPTDPNASPSAG